MELTENHIAAVYYSGLILSLVSVIIILLYLRPLKTVIKKITGRDTPLWTRSFKSSLVLAGLVGAMSVSFRDCAGSYDYLLDSGFLTVMKGFEQLSAAFEHLAFILLLWLVVFLAIRLKSKERKDVYAN